MKFSLTSKFKNWERIGSKWRGGKGKLPKGGAKGIAAIRRLQKEIDGLPLEYENFHSV